MSKYKAGMVTAPVKTRFLSTLTSMVAFFGVHLTPLARLHSQLLAGETKPSLPGLIIEQGFDQVLFSEVGP